jgi:hypothetical protein
MTRSILTLILTSALAAACSQPSPPQSGAADKASASTTPQPGGASTAPPAEASAQAQPGPAQPQAVPAAGSPSASAVAAPAPETTAPPEPKFREVTIPAETAISVTLVTSVASNTSKIEDQVVGKLASPIVVSGTTVVPAGSEVLGTVIDAKESGRVKGRASVAFRFSRLRVRGENHRIQTAQIAREAAASTKSDVKKGAVGAGAGAIIGGIAGGGTGAAIGAGVGGAGAVMATKGKEVQLPAGTRVSTRLLQALTLQVPNAEK